MVNKIHFPLDLKHRDYDLNGPDGNAYAVMGAVSSIISQIGRAFGVPQKQIAKYIDEYVKQATSGDYEHLLLISNKYVEFNWLRDEEEEN